MTSFTITSTSPISDDYSNRTLPNIREIRCSMHRPRSLTSDIIVVAPQFYNKHTSTININLWNNSMKFAFTFNGTIACIHESCKKDMQALTLAGSTRENLVYSPLAALSLYKWLCIYPGKTTKRHWERQCLVWIHQQSNKNVVFH